MDMKSRSLPSDPQRESSFQHPSIDSRAPLTEPYTETPNHDYANPLELMKENEAKNNSKMNGHRKKNCVIYEPAGAKSRKLSDEDEDGGVRIVHRHDKLFRILFFMLFVMVLLAICLSLLSLIGFKLGGDDGNNSTCKCPAATVPVYSASTKENETTTPSSPVTKSDFDERLRRLEETVVPSLVAKIKQLEAQINATANKTVVGPPGPRGPSGAIGPVGERGPAGQSNMAACASKTSSVTAQLTQPYSRIFSSTDHIQASPGHVMLGSTCSALGAAEYSLFADKTSNVTSYYCICAGKAETDALSQSTATMVCRITWWECPLS